MTFLEHFFNCRDAVICKAEDLKNLDDNEQLALDGIMVIDNGFIKTDIVDYEKVHDIMNDIDLVDEFKSATLKKSEEKLVMKFANDFAARNIDITAIQSSVRDHENKFPDDVRVCRILYDVTNIWKVWYFRVA